MENPKKILKGFGNLVTGSNKEISDIRMEICIGCDIHHNNWCLKKRGGCGCYLPAKTTIHTENCPKGKW
jgi:hypothetical protein